MWCHQAIFYIIFTALVIARVKSEDMVQIIVRQCDNCDSSSFVVTSIGAGSSVEVVQLAVPRSSHFFIIQVHHHMHTLRLSYADESSVQNSVRGTNIGLNQINQDTGNYSFNLFHNFTTASAVLFAVTSYSKSAPMPGGCNMEFSINTAPYEKITYDDALITVDVQNASINNGLCELQENIIFDFYVLHAKNQMNPDQYQEILDMMTPDSIKKHGFKVNKPTGCPELRRYFNNYRGFPVVFAVVASYGNESASYVPAFTYGCDMTKGKHSCYDTSYNVNFISMYSAFIFSYLLLLFPRITNAIPVFNISFYGIITLFELCGLVSYYYTFGIILGIIGVLIGLERFYMFTKYSKYCNVLLRFYAASIAVSCIYTYSTTGGEVICQTWGYFWILYIVVMLVVMWPLFNIGAQAIAIAYNLLMLILIFYGYEEVLYININAIRRITVSQFYLANLYMPTIPNELYFIMLAIWMICYYMSIVDKLREKRGNADDNDNEKAPLLK